MKRVYFVYGCVCLILFSIVFYGSYAFFNAFVNVRREENNKINVTTKEFDDVVLSGSNSIKVDDLIPGEEATANFDVTNTNDIMATYSLYLKDVVNTFVNKSDLVCELSYKLNDSMEETVLLSSSTNKAFPSTDSLLVEDVTIPANSVEHLTLKIKYIDTKSNQIDDVGKEFGATIYIGDKGEL